MAPGIFSGTFYILHEPVHVPQLTVHLTALQKALVENIMSTNRIQRLKREFGAIGESIIFHKDHYELVEDADVRNYQPLIQHSNNFNTINTIYIHKSIYITNFIS